MYKLFASNEKVSYEISELAKMFVPSDQFVIDLIDDDSDKNEQKRRAYNILSKGEKKTLDWGILTGVRPTKLYSQLVREKGEQDTFSVLKNDYFLSEAKINLLQKTYQTQKDVLGIDDPSAVGVYIGIPFCPSRCLYCSFTSNIISKAKASAYILALEKEIKATANIMNRLGLFAESVYIGGGTPTSLDDEDFETLLKLTKDYFINPNTKEWTVEAGRPDTITIEKFKLIEKYGADRISINPQTMKDETLKLIGRNHTSEDIVKAFEISKDFGFKVNMDLITGLPEESPKDFDNTLNKILEFNPENITVHTLAVKKASRLIEEDSSYAYKQADVVKNMLEIADNLLGTDYSPYYLYRQKHMAGNFENVGYCRNNTASLYNIRIMEENQSIIALGAGGISKMYYPAENRLERVPNVSNYEIYIERIDEMIDRKEKGIIL